MMLITETDLAVKHITEFLESLIKQIREEGRLVSFEIFLEPLNETPPDMRAYTVKLLLKQPGQDAGVRKIHVRPPSGV